MDIKHILKNTLKFSGLVLLTLSLDFCSPKEKVIKNPKEIVIESYLEALKQEDVKKTRNYCSKERANVINWEAAIKYIRQEYKDVIKVHSYIPDEGKDIDNIYWMEHKDGRYSPVSLVDEDGWKIDDVGPPINHPLKKAKSIPIYI